MKVILAVSAVFLSACTHSVSHIPVHGYLPPAADHSLERQAQKRSQLSVIDNEIAHINNRIAATEARRTHFRQLGAQGQASRLESELTILRSERSRLEEERAQLQVE